MKRKIKFIILLGILLVITSNLALFSKLNIKSPEKKQSESPNFDNLEPSASEIIISTPENISYIEPMRGYYTATYGFENDEDGTIPEEWEEAKGDPSMLNEIIDELDGHKKVIHMDKGNTYGDNNNLFQNFSKVQDYGTIELWGRTTDVSQESSWHLKSGTFNQYSIAGLRIMDNSFQFKNSSAWFPVSYTANNNQWYHIRIQFEGGTGNHYGLNQYYWRFFVNNVQFGDYQMILPKSNVSHIMIHQNWRYDNFHIYTDAIGYSWDSNYIVGDNLKEGLLLNYKNFTSLDWKGYSLDRQSNKTILGNTTIPMPEDGLHTIQVFGNDSLGAIHESDVRYFTVGTSVPEITITTPTDNQLFGKPNPNFDLSVIGPDLNATWYSLDVGATNYTFSGTTGTIDQNEWDKIGNGTATIEFYANNSLGNVGSAEVTVRKDIIAPVITIYQPTLSQEFIDIPPIFNISINEPNYNSSWYTAEGALTNITFTGTIGMIDETLWNSLPRGVITILFYSKDKVGNIGYSEVYVVKNAPEQGGELPEIPGYDLATLIGILITMTIIFWTKNRTKK